MLISSNFIGPARSKIESNLTIKRAFSVSGEILQFCPETIFDKCANNLSTADSELGICRTSLTNFINDFGYYVSFI